LLFCNARTGKRNEVTGNSASDPQNSSNADPDKPLLTWVGFNGMEKIRVTKTKVRFESHNSLEDDYGSGSRAVLIQRHEKTKFMHTKKEV
jgi:hypothetical protein